MGIGRWGVDCGDGSSGEPGEGPVVLLAPLPLYCCCLSISRVAAAACAGPTIWAAAPVL